MGGIPFTGWAENTFAGRTNLAAGFGSGRSTPRKRRRKAKATVRRAAPRKARRAAGRAAKFVKGSAAAKAHMARLRKMVGRKRR